MIPAHRQRNYLQSALYVIVAGICATILLERLLAYTEAAEKYAMEATLSRLHAALYARVAYYAMRREFSAIEAMPGVSPFVTAEAAASNYLGEFDGVPAEASGGRWLFDRGRRELVYLPRMSRFLKGGAGTGAPAYLRFKVQLAESPQKSYTGVALEPVEAYRWAPPL